MSDTDNAVDVDELAQLISDRARLGDSVWPHRTARDILDNIRAAIRAGKVPGVFASGDPALRAVAEQAQAATAECAKLRAEVERLRSAVVWGFYENEVPEYVQGKAGENEICSELTADEANGMLKQIVDLRAERDRLRAEVERLKADLEYAGSAGHVDNARRAAADEARAESRQRICDLEDDARALEAQRDRLAGLLRERAIMFGEESVFYDCNCQKCRFIKVVKSALAEVRP